MNGWMPMLNLAFNDYNNMSGENKLLLIVAKTVFGEDGCPLTSMQTFCFDTIGRMIDLAAVRYGYNVRSNLTGINSDVFSQTLYYKPKVNQRDGSFGYHLLNI